MDEKKVKQIIIKSQSGYVPDEEAYKDEMILDEKSIYYRFDPSHPFINQSREWSFTTSNMEYQWLFEGLSKDVLSIISRQDKYVQIVDDGSISFTVIYDDQTTETCEFELSPSDFHEYLSYIRKFVPLGEGIPEMLKTREDYCEEDNLVNSTVKKLYDGDGILFYEGCTSNGKPYGAGTAYYPDGTVYQEGVFDIKGLLYGREYYPDGKLRFEGSYKINRGYGPNYPIYGTAYDTDGNKEFSGEFKIKRSGLGYPMVKEPAGYGKVVQAGAPSVNPIMWNDI